MEKVINLINNRKSIRKYFTTQIEEEKLDQILKATASAPTSTNGQQYLVMVTKDPEKKKIISDNAWKQQQIIEASVFLLFCADFSKAMIASEKHNMENKNIHNVEALVTATGDAFIASTLAVVAAEALGLATCYIGAIRGNLEKMREVFGLPDYVLPIVGMTIGYADSSPDVKPKMFKGNIQFEKYNKKEVLDDIMEYDVLMKEYFKNRSARPGERENWTKRMADIYIQGYDTKIKEYIKKHWPKSKMFD